MSAMRELVDAVLNYSSAREAVRAAPEGSTDLSQALGWAASAWSRVADALQKVTQARSYAKETDIAGAAKCEKTTAAQLEQGRAA